MDTPMTRRPPSPITLDELLARADELAALARRYGVSNLRVFGSVARGTADSESDVDLLVDAAPETGLLAVGAFAAAVEEVVGAPVQVATVPGLKPRIRERVLQEAVPL